ncbi:Proline-rich receptor-like protein kinase [Lachnellula hyalina]|uniref:Proline-rich receptor-like protein kinase n=1 Tax=Lachnellula hyalina TaxID=1316788 RepID=A0A8H8QVG2_9HELO|nr:Proline-rich receptor-like protein kinase [Lachnellula hyalina]TVY23266.1 Proline-rich receptor-like protein kinase [Lachnellula hyalina]
MENTTPRLRLNSLPIRAPTFSLRSSKTFPNAPYFDWDKLPRYQKFESLGRMLRKCMTEEAGTNNNKGFLPPAILEHILSREVIEHELKSQEYRYTAETVDVMFQTEEEALDDSADFPGGTKTYFIVFATLALLDKVCDIYQFMEMKDTSLGDQDLPNLKLHQDEDGKRELRRGEELQQMRCFDGFVDHELESFDDYQWRLRVPTFALGPKETIRHYDLHDKDILPWYEEHSVSQNEVMSGGYGSVKKVKIHPLCHDYHETLKAINVSGGQFAVKTLKNSDAIKFQDEVNMLKKFNGLVHDHLVTLLGTFTYKGQFSMIFPWAECDVENYWLKINPMPNLEDIEFVRWVSRQCRGIMESVNVIHNPKHPETLPKETLYGRHGDIKAENILWFKSPDEADRGIWVISDLGLSTFNREVSRSMVPNQSILYTPGYRPPECDIKGGKISRAFDIWTLGCFYLEMTCWFLGGRKLKDNFETDRTTTYITGSRADIFFDLELNGEDKTNETFIALIKPQVVRMIDDLHNHPNCTKYIHDMLEIIEKDMIVVLNQERTRSPKLLKKLNEMNQKCIDDVDYCMKKTPVKRTFQAPIGTEARLSENAMNMVTKNNMRGRLSTHVPKRPVQKSPRVEELENVD